MARLPTVLLKIMPNPNASLKSTCNVQAEQNQRTKTGPTANQQLLLPSNYSFRNPCLHYLGISTPLKALSNSVCQACRCEDLTGAESFSAACSTRTSRAKTDAEVDSVVAQARSRGSWSIGRRYKGTRKKRSEVSNWSTLWCEDRI